MENLSLLSGIDDGLTFPTSTRSILAQHYYKCLRDLGGLFRRPSIGPSGGAELPSLVGNAFNWIVWRSVQSDMRLLPGFRQLTKNWGLVGNWRATGKPGKRTMDGERVRPALPG